MTLTCKFYGQNTGGIFSKVWGRNINITADEINAYTLLTYLPVWDNDTYILSSFENNLEGGSIPSSFGNVQNLLIYRLNEESSFLDYLTTKDLSYSFLYDYNCLNGSTYKYYIFVQGEFEISNPALSNSIESNYYGWYLIDLENNISYQLDIAFNGANRDHVEDYVEHNVNSKTNTFTRGANHYIFGTISAILSKDNLKENIINTNDELVAFRNLIRNDKPKLLKSRRNKSYKVLTQNYKETLVNPALSQNIYKATFDYREVGEV